MGFFLVLSFSLRTISTAGKHGLIAAEIPMLSVPFKDPTLSNYEAEFSQVLEATTPLLILTDRAFIFGEIRSFAENISSVSNKFTVRHSNGAPNMIRLMDDMDKWLRSRASKHKIANSGLLVFMPADNIPSPIMIQTMANLEKSASFEKIILAGGLK